MNDPKPLRSGPMSPYARSLLAAARKESPRASTEAAVLTALGVGSGLVATSLVAAAAARPLYARALQTGWYFVSSKIGIAVLAASVGVGTGWVAGTAHERDVEREASRVERATTAAAAPPAVTTAAPVAPEPSPEPSAVLDLGRSPDAPTSAPTLPAPSAAPVRQPAPEPKVAEAPSAAPVPEPPPEPTAPTTPPAATLSKQLAAIQDARGAVLSKDGKAALADVDRYDRENPDGSFAEEALALRVEALRLTGDEAGAAKALERLRTRYPSSVHLRKLARPSH